MKLHVSVSPVRSGQFVAVVRGPARDVLAMSLPTSDRNNAMRNGLGLRSLLG